ncbi:hypothetical protein K449DRAFT_394780 [Hypoxylon sp. EC38]|nr:hypothetical protein K449DRAFT_394780 [Hypoxylon sp. EC38]
MATLSCKRLEEVIHDFTSSKMGKLARSGVYQCTCLYLPLKGWQWEGTRCGTTLALLLGSMVAHEEIYTFLKIRIQYEVHVQILPQFSWVDLVARANTLGGFEYYIPPSFWKDSDISPDPATRITQRSRMLRIRRSVRGLPLIAGLAGNTPVCALQPRELGRVAVLAENYDAKTTAENQASFLKSDVTYQDHVALSLDPNVVTVKQDRQFSHLPGASSLSEVPSYYLISLQDYDELKIRAQHSLARHQVRLEWISTDTTGRALYSAISHMLFAHRYLSSNKEPILRAVDDAAELTGPLDIALYLR